MLFVCLLASLTLIFTSCKSQSQNKQTLANLSPELKEWAHYLASDEMRGRSNGSPEMEEAATYIAEKYASFGLQAAPGTENFIQEYDFNSRRVGTIHERNVVAWIEGSDPELKDEYIIMTAHFDHVGVGRPLEGDSIYNGANDNVAGTCTIMGVAKQLAGIKEKLGRSVVFLSVSGEEMGIHGSRYYVSDPLFPLENTWGNLNIEMTGHCTLLGKHRYYLTGTDYSTMDEMIRAYNEYSGTPWQIVDTVAMAQRLFFASDNVAFAMIQREEEVAYGIPGHTFCTHGGEDHLHRPNDEPQFMDYDNMGDMVNYLTGMVVYFSKTDQRPEWTSERFKDFRDLE